MQSGRLDDFRGITPALRRRSIDLQVDDLYLPGETPVIRASMSDQDSLAGGLIAEVTSDNGLRNDYLFRESGDGWELTLEALDPGLYRVRVRGAVRGGGAPAPVREVFEVAGA